MITVRLAVPEDGPGVARVQVEGWQQHYRGLIPDAYLDGLDREMYALRWRERISQPEHGGSTFTMVASAAGDPAGEVIGFAFGCRERECGDPLLGEVAAIYVLDSHQGSGTGRKLMVALADRLANLGCRRLLIWVLAENHSARRFYEAMGGRAAETRVREIGGADLPEVGYAWDDLTRLAGGR